jgi:hypothetical protein
MWFVDWLRRTNITVSGYPKKYRCAQPADMFLFKFLDKFIMNPKPISITIYNKSVVFKIIRVGYRCIVVTDTIGNLQTTGFGALQRNLKRKKGTTVYSSYRF